MSRYSSDSDTDYRRSIKKKDRSHSLSRSPYRSHKSGKYKHRRSPSSNLERSRNRFKEYSKSKRKDRYRSRSNSSHGYRSKSRSSSESSSYKDKKKRSKRKRRSRSRRKYDHDSRSKSRSPVRKTNSHKKSKTKRRRKSDSDTESNCSTKSKNMKSKWENDKTDKQSNIIEPSVDFSKGVSSLMTDNFQRQEAIDRINEPNFEQIAFKSSKGVDMEIRDFTEKDKERSVVSNEDKELLLKNDTVFADNILLEDKEGKLNRWVRRLYNIGQQMLLESSKGDLNS